MPSNSSARASKAKPQRLALGLFHFNLYYVAGNEPGYHRYCTEAVIPFLRTVASHDWLRVSFEMAGSGLEFLHTHYPEALTLLRSLIAAGRVELISANYYPTAWVAFPGSDLRKGVDLNTACLERLKLKAAPFFFSQEGFFGPGLREFADRFPAAICSADYLHFMAPAEKIRPIYQLGGLRVVVGSSYLSNLLEARRKKNGADEIPAHFGRRKKLSAQDPAWARGRVGNVEYQWYHLGSGHHFCAASSPGDWDHFYHDRAQTDRNVRVLESFVREGFRCATLTEFLDLTANEPLPALPFVTEGSWNTPNSEGVFAWMGAQEKSWQNSSAILGAAWRSRRDVLTACAKLNPRTSSRSKKKTATEKENRALWRLQLRAECSDPLGWYPSAEEVDFGRAAANETTVAATQCLLRRGGIARPTSDEFAPTETSAVPLVNAELFGAKGYLQFQSLGPKLFALDVAFRGREHYAGVRFERTSHVAYSPTGLDRTLTILPLTSKGPSNFTLPLANGLLSLAPKLHVIRLNEHGQPAVRIDRDSTWCDFGVRGHLKGHYYRWRFLIFVGDGKAAVDLALRANQIEA